MTQKRPYFWLIALTVIPAVLLYAITQNINGWRPLMQSFVSTLNFTPAMGRLFTSSSQLADLLTNILFHTGPFVSVLMALPLGAACWRAMTWSRPVVRFLCYLLWSAGMGALCIYLMYHFALTGGLLLQFAVRPILMVWVAGGLFWLMLNHLREEQQPGRLTVVVTLIAAVLLGVGALTMEHWPDFLRLNLSYAEPGFGLGVLFLQCSLFGLCLMLLPAGAACWRAMTWGQPAVRVLCCLLWAAVMALLCVCLPCLSALSFPVTLLLAVPPVLTAWLAGGLLWLMLNRMEK